MRRITLALAVIVFAACTSGGTRQSTPPQDRADVAGSEAFLAALGQVSNYHHLADVVLSDGDTEAAMKYLALALEVQFPADADVEVVDAVQLDTRARLAKLDLGAGRLDDALKIVDDGIAQAHGDSFFLGNLYTVAGQVHDARGEKRAAIDMFDKSIQCEKRVQAKVLKEKTP